MTNYEFIEQYVINHEGKHLNRQNYYIDGDFISYSTLICSIDGKTAKLNTRKYSSTTSKLQSNMKSILKKHGYKIIEYTGEPCILWTYGYQSPDNKWTVKELKERNIF